MNPKDAERSSSSVLNPIIKDGTHLCLGGDSVSPHAIGIAGAIESSKNFTTI